MGAVRTPVETAQSDDTTFEDFADQSDDWPYCECGNQTSLEEEDTNQCDCCGKALW